MWNARSHKVTLQAGDETIVADGAVIKEMSISAPAPHEETIIGRLGEEYVFPKAPEPITISLEMVVNDLSFVDKLFNSNDLPKIRNKTVEDCTVEELMFAVREKIKRKE